MYSKRGKRDPGLICVHCFPDDIDVKYLVELLTIRTPMLQEEDTSMRRRDFEYRLIVRRLQLRVVIFFGRQILGSDIF